MYLFKNFLNKNKTIFVERFKDKNVEPLFLCEKKANFFKRLKKRDDLLFFKVNSDFKDKTKKNAVLFSLPIVAIAILSGGIYISMNACNKNGVNIFTSKPFIIEQNDIIDNKFLLSVNKPGNKDIGTFVNNICDYKNGIKCNKTIIEDLDRLILAAKKDGFNINVLIGYISSAFREKEYERILNEELNSGKTYIKAEAEAKKRTFNYYENEMGLSVNFSNKDGYSPEFINSDEYKWLRRNSATFGFILRAPKGKEIKTGMEFDPTLFRYVGVEHAKKMRMLSMCLEEYRNYLKAKWKNF